MNRRYVFLLTRLILGAGLSLMLLLTMSGSPLPVYADLGTDFFFVGVEPLDTESIAWGDWDGDGDLDLAVGGYHFIFVYENDGKMLKLDPNSGLGWAFISDVKIATSLAWGDWDNDGDLDLAVGATGSDGITQGNLVYENDEGTLKLDPANGFGWQASLQTGTTSVAWGDWDGDGDLDLAVGNGEIWKEFSQVYENDGGTLKLDPENGFGWKSPVEMYTTSVAWGDWDGDGDLDLAIGNGGCTSDDPPICSPNQVYEYDEIAKTLKLDPVNGFGWEEDPSDAKDTISLAWGDWDGDRDLDLAE